MTIDALISKWLGKQTAGERAEYQQFLVEFAQALRVPTPGDDGIPTEDYRFEAPVRSEAIYGTKGSHRIDLYKRDCFILEAKQRQLKPGEVLPDDEPAPPAAEPVFDMFGHAIGLAPAPKPVRRYDRLMEDARLQAQRYALALPADHRTPPFLIVADIGRSFELYFDYAANGRGYAPFPDERSYRIGLAELADPAIADRMRAVWTKPQSIDPRLRAAEVTRDVMVRLTRVAAALETEHGGKGQVDAALRVEATSLFLMRTLFCMFAEDVGRDLPPAQQLLPADSFKRFLADAADRSDLFWRSGLTELWSRMNDPREVNRFWSHGDAIVRYFNGNLFSNTQIFDLSPEHKRELLVAAGKDWRQVEPAIFGTLLEQVLSAPDRARLGAHYTPRAYVERVVEATIMDVLRPEWERARDAARAKADAGDSAGAIADARAFADRLAEVRVLDPACGTGNFLYVALDALMRLEGEVGQFVLSLGGSFDPRVGPNQMLGLELNPRAAVIAELVLWIGWLRYRLQNRPDAIGEPVLPTLTNINGGTHGGFDAVLVRTATGEPDTAAPRRPVWPEAEFIVGNPPFIGGKDLRARLDAAHPGYAEALWRANPGVPPSADFVMQWWDRAAELLTAPGTPLRRFGFVTTNSITQVFSRRVIARHLASDSSPERGGGPAELVEGGSGELPGSAEASVGAENPLHHAAHGPPPRAGEDLGKLHLVLAISDHPWTRATKDAAAVRIAITVAAPGPGEGTLIEIVGEAGLDTDKPKLDERRTMGRIHADLSVGTDVTGLVPLRANQGLCSRGVQLMGSGFIVTPEKARELGLGRRPGLDAYIREYRNGRDLLQRPRGVMVIDLFGLTENEVMERFPEVYQHLLMTVRVGRAEQVKRSPTADAKTYLVSWWVFGKPRTELRPALRGLPRYITTVESAARRIFEFVDGNVLPDNKIIVVSSNDAYIFAILSSAIHIEWWLANAGMLGSYGRPAVYVKSQAFDPFPFPNSSTAQRAVMVDLAERLDATRRTALAENSSLTMTGLYDLVVAIRDGTLPPDKEAAAVKARARIVAKLHDDLDLAVADAYGWGDEWRRASLPPAEIVARLVALNAERAGEEKAGHVRWLRPDYQRPRFERRGDVA